MNVFRSYREPRAAPRSSRLSFTRLVVKTPPAGTARPHLNREPKPKPAPQLIRRVRQVQPRAEPQVFSGRRRRPDDAAQKFQEAAALALQLGQRAHVRRAR